jgi:hypothetical protein
MDISALSSGTSGTSGSALSGPSDSKKALDSRGLNRALNQGAIVSGLLPALSSGSSGHSGSHGSAGLSSDIYTAVGMQTQGMMSRGLMGIQIANVSLGIDMSRTAKDAATTKDPDEVSGEETSAAPDGVPAETEVKPPVDEASHAQRVLDGMLKEEEPPASRYYSSPELSNPALGGLLNSLG